MAWITTACLTIVHREAAEQPDEKATEAFGTMICEIAKHVWPHHSAMSGSVSTVDSAVVGPTPPRDMRLEVILEQIIALAKDPDWHTAHRQVRNRFRILAEDGLKLLKE